MLFTENIVDSHDQHSLSLKEKEQLWHWA